MSIKVGVIGVGHLGQHHARIYSQMPDVELVGVADTRKERAEEIAKLYNTQAYTDFRELLDKVSAVSVVVPTKDHYLVASECIKRKIHTLVEKPITKTLEEANKLVESAKENGVILQVGHIERFNSAVISVEKIITNPLFIESHRLAPFKPRGTDVAVVLDIMIHDIDIILSLVNSPVVELSAVGVPIISDNIDIANARLTFQSGCIANVTASRVSRESVRKIRIFQPYSYISLDYQQGSVEVYRLQDEIVKKLKKGGSYTELVDENNIPIPIEQIISHEELSIEKKEPLLVELSAFIHSVKTSSPPKVSGEDGRDALAVALKILDKIEERLPQKYITTAPKL